MKLRTSSRAALFLLVAAASAVSLACGGDGSPRTAPPPAAPTASATPSALAPPPAASANADPTVLSSGDAARDKALAPKIEAIVDAFGNFDAQLSPDGKRVLFRSNRDGVPELFVGEVGKPAAPAKKVVPGPERVQSARFSWDGKWIVFRRDKGADENFRLYRVKAEGGDIVELTPGDPMHRDYALLARKKPDVLVFSARKTSSPETTVWVGSIATPGDAKVVFTDPNPMFAVALSPDGTRALLLRFVSPTNQILFEVDLAGGKSKRVYPPEGKSAAVHATDYSADGKRILFATDEGGEANVLVAVDGATYKQTARWVQDKPKTAKISELAVSPKGDQIAVAVDAGNKNDIRVLDAQTLKVTRELKLPLGATFLGDFAPDGRRFVLTQSLPDRPVDAYLANADTGALEPLRADERPGLADLPGLEVATGTIPAHDGMEIPVHWYLPKNRDPNKRLPVIAHFHGGPAASSRIGWNWMARSFTSQGFAFVEPNIRGSTGFGRAYEMADNREKRADAIKDVATVNQWLRAQPWADPERLVVFGGSYGGYIVLMGLTRQPTLWRAGVDFVGVANLFTFLKTTDQTIRSAFVEEFGDIDKDRQLLEEFSPMRDKDKIVAPLFVYQGQNDPRVPRGESDQVVASLRARKIPVEYMVAQDEGHSLDRKPNKVGFVTRVVRFLADHAPPRP